ncbi:MAG: hypothetical protein E7Z64_02160 [Thermoplasmata archaeon]|nr:hypothetical protein [Thermoplasmata archaeon]
MQRFIGRSKELALLTRIYEEESNKTCMIFGRRRIGKTTLIERFISDKPHINIELDDATYKINLDIINNSISEFTSSQISTNSMRESMEIIKELCKKNRMVIVFDELPYLTSNYSAGASEIQHLTDWVVRNTESMIIISGSSVSLLLEEVMNSGKPLYKRFMFTINLGPIEPEEAREFQPDVSDDDFIRTYLTLGGVTAYHSLTGNRCYKDIMNGYILNRFGFIQNDIQFGINREMGNAGRDSVSIFKSIVLGDNTYNEMKNRTGLPDVSLQQQLERMIVSGFIEKRDSLISSKKSKVYRISDPMTSFYYSVIDRNKEMMGSEDPYDDLKQVISSWLGPRFEDYCRDFVRRNYPCSEVGSWWGKAPIIKNGKKVKDENGKTITESVDIDIVATVRKGNDRMNLFGECKFTRTPMDFSALNTLQIRVRSLKGSYNTRFALFSLSGFTDDLREYATDNNIALFDLDILLGKKEIPRIE